MLHCRNSPDFPMPGAIGGLCPWLDLTHSLPSWHLNRKECILPDASNDPIYTTPMRSHLYVDHNRQLVLPSVSPIFAAETTPICPVMLHIGACDRLRDDSLYFATQTFTNSPIGVEIYQGRAHVFQLFAPFSEFSKTSLKRLGSFLHEQTGRQTKRSVFEARTLFVSNSSGFPISEVDANAILVAGIAQLIRDGTWVLGNEGEIVKSVQVGHAKF